MLREYGSPGRVDYMLISIIIAFLSLQPSPSYLHACIISVRSASKTHVGLQARLVIGLGWKRTVKHALRSLQRAKTAPSSPKGPRERLTTCTAVRDQWTRVAAARTDMRGKSKDTQYGISYSLSKLLFDVKLMRER